MTTSLHTKNLADLYNLAPLEWSDVHRELTGDITQAPDSGGPNRHTFWLSTIDLDGRPHVTAVGVTQAHDHYFFCGSPRSRKIRNIERDPRCTFGIALDDYDVTLEGSATRIADEGRLQNIALLFSDWGPTVAEGGFTHDYMAPSAGPSPWYVYEFVPERAYALATTNPGGASLWTF